MNIRKFLASAAALFLGTRADGAPLVAVPGPAHRTHGKGPAAYRAADPWVGCSGEGVATRQRRRAEGRRLAFSAITESHPALSRATRREYARSFHRSPGAVL